MEPFYCQNSLINETEIACKVQCILCKRFEDKSFEDFPDDWDDD